MDWREKKELNDEFLEEVGRFADAFEDLLDKLNELEKINDEILRIDVQHNTYLVSKQDRLYNSNSDLIGRIKDAIFGCHNWKT